MLSANTVVDNQLRVRPCQECDLDGCGQEQRRGVGEEGWAPRKKLVTGQCRGWPLLPFGLLGSALDFTVLERNVQGWRERGWLEKVTHLEGGGWQGQREIQTMPLTPDKQFLTLIRLFLSTLPSTLTGSHQQHTHEPANRCVSTA